MINSATMRLWIFMPKTINDFHCVIYYSICTQFGLFVQSVPFIFHNANPSSFKCNIPSGQIKRQRTIIFGMRRWRNRWTTCHLHPFVALQKIVPFTFLQEKKGHFLFLLFFGYFFFWRWMKEIVKCQKLLWWERKISLGIQDDDDHFFMLYWNTFRMTKGHKLNLKRKGIEQN